MIQSHRRFVILPYAGGSASSFRTLGNILSASGDVFRADYPELADSEISSHCGIKHFSDYVYSLLQPIISNVVLFGHSMGGLVAYELARRIQLDTQIEHLFISGCAFPTSSMFQEIRQSPSRSDLAKILVDRGGIPASSIAQPNEGRLAQHLDAILSYRFSSMPLSCPLTCFAGSDDTIAPHESMLLWRNITSQPFHIFDFSGGHFFFSGKNRNISNAIRQSLTY